MNNPGKLLLVSVALVLVGEAMAWPALANHIEWLGWTAIAVYAAALGFAAASVIARFREENQWTRLCQRLGAA